MKKYILIYVLIFLNLFLVSASHSATYTMIEESVLVEISSFEEGSEFVLPFDSSALDIRGNYEIVGGDKKIIVSKDNLGLNIEYVSKSFIDKTGSDYFFVLQTDSEGNHNLTLILPEGAILSSPKIVSPNEDFIESDGRRIILNWEDLNEKQILVKYEFPSKSNFWLYFLIFVLLFGFVFYHFYNKRKLNNKIKQSINLERQKNKKKFEGTNNKILQNLYGDEKKIVNYLISKKNNEAWTKEILRELEITKVRLSRKLRSLEQKGRIKKIPYGNENIIRLLK